MLKTTLNTNWNMIDGSKKYYHVDLPASVYSVLIGSHNMPDPYYRDNEKLAAEICERDFVFYKQFELDSNILACDKIYLNLDGIDTLADIYLNDRWIGFCNNMHRRWEFDIRGIAMADNQLSVHIHSPNKFIREAQQGRPLTGVEHCMEGYPYLRKAHYMFGWDWGPKLPDMGIWRGVSVCGYKDGRIRSVRYTQQHHDGKVVLTCKADLDIWAEDVRAQMIMTSPGNAIRLASPINNGELTIEINDPQLWWVRGLGSQPLYNCEVRLISGGREVDSDTKRIGLRTLTVSQQKDEYGEEFCFVNNGVKVFAMGANYIPEDQLLPRITKERTEKLIGDCMEANFNMIRVWGGGVYPDDRFYDLCDENGLIVWQDFMFACSAYLLSPDFETSVRGEIWDNIIRLRNHPSLGLWCGNNEIESAWVGWGWPDDRQAKEDYIKLFESIIPEAVLTLDPETFYWPSSPSSGGNFKDPSSNDAGDVHYWAMWHNFEPVSAFRKQYYRFCSEYGFESIPDIKTCRSFCDEKQGDLEISSVVMQAHQKCTQGSEKLMYYISQLTDYEGSFERLVYCSQLVQADCIRQCVEHMRRARGRCMGSVYWQLNDSNPVISWSSVDYYGRWKALHYAAAKFYAPVLISCDESDPVHPSLWVTNDTLIRQSLTLVCHLRNNKGEIIDEFIEEELSEPLSAQRTLDIDLSQYITSYEDRTDKYLEYTLEGREGLIGSGTAMFVPPKEFRFLRAGVRTAIKDDGGCFSITLRAESFVKGVCLSFKDFDGIFSDNWFDIHGSEPVTVTVDKQKGLNSMNIKQQLVITHY